MEVEVRCERCGRVLGPELFACPEREGGACPYQVLEQRSRALVWWIVGFVAALPLFACLTTVSVRLVRGSARDLPGGAPLGRSPLLALLAVLVTLFSYAVAALLLVAVLRSKRRTLYNPRTGAFFWAAYGPWGQVGLRQVGTPFTAAALEGSGGVRTAVEGLEHPASITALALNTGRVWDYPTLAGQILTFALLRLAAQGRLEFRTARLYKAKRGTGFVSAQPSTGASSALPKQIPHPHSLRRFAAPARPALAPERSAAAALEAQAATTEGWIEQALLHRLHVAAGEGPGLSARELLAAFFEGYDVRRKRVEWVIRRAHEDAAARGLAQAGRQGRPMLDARLAAQLQPAAEAVRDGIQAHALLSEVENDVRRAILDLDASNG